MHITTRLNKQY